MPHHHEPDPPIDPATAEWQEWQDQQYVPGYFLGTGRWSLTRGQRPNRVGIILLVVGSASAAMTAAGATLTALAADGTALLVFLAPAALALVHIAAGVRMLRGSRHTR